MTVSERSIWYGALKPRMKTCESVALVKALRTWTGVEIRSVPGCANLAMKSATHEWNWRGREIGRTGLHRPDTCAVCELSGVSWRHDFLPSLLRLYVARLEDAPAYRRRHYACKGNG